MISKIKKNQINLFKLKKLSEMTFIENKFNVFLKKKFFSNSKKKNQYLYKNKTCACGAKFKKGNKRIFINPFEYIKCELCNTISIDPMINNKGLDFIYSQNGIYSIYRKNFVEKKSKKFLRENVINQRKVEQILSLFDKKNFSLVDFGCGNGGFLKLLKKNGIRDLAGVDKKFDNNCIENGIAFSNSLEAYKKKIQLYNNVGCFRARKQSISTFKICSKVLKKKWFFSNGVPKRRLNVNELYNEK